MRQHNLRILFFLLVLWGVAVACSRREARFRIGVSQCSEDEWRRQMNSEILREAHFYEDVEVDIRTAVDDNDRQAKDIRELIAEGVDLLIVAPNEATPITPVVEEAYNRGNRFTDCQDCLIHKRLHSKPFCGGLPFPVRGGPPRCTGRWREPC